MTIQSQQQNSANKDLRFLYALFLSVPLLFASACGGGGGGSTPPASSTITSVSASCTPTSVQTGQTSQCSAAVTGTGSYSSTVTWSAVSGTISSSGLYTAPASVPASGSDTITAASTQDSTKSGSATVTVTVPPTITAVSVACSPVSIMTNQTSTCAPTVTGTGSFSTSVTWSVSPTSIGSISSSGVFTPSGAGTATVKATSAQDSTKSGTATVSVTSGWVWMSGGSTVGSNGGQPGVYGTLGTPADVNVPGGRFDGTTWTDPRGHLWLFGGYAMDSVGGYGYLNDLWKFDPSTNEWTWMGGSSTVGTNNGGPGGVYGKLGKPAAGNIPGGRYGATGWVDSSGHLWLFGGIGFDANDTQGSLNDFWEFDPIENEWTWMGGSSIVPEQFGGVSGVYGTLRTPAPGNIPGARLLALSWTDSSGHFWLFGGDGYFDDLSSGYQNEGSLNDLWEFDPSTDEWTWMGGSSNPSCRADGCGQPGVYGTLGTPAPSNIPGGRRDGTTWSDTSGHLWLFGGGSYDAIGNFGSLNDLWEFDPSSNEWTWMGGTSALQCTAISASMTCTTIPGEYGSQGTPAPSNIPGARDLASSWTDSSGHLWLFGGDGYDSKGIYSELNDLWEFDLSTNEWTWMGGSSAGPGTWGGGVSGIYGALGIAAAGNVPGGRSNAMRWTDGSGKFWLFGGRGYDVNGSPGLLNDMWRYQP